jgi:hypothetical protein
MAKNSADGYPLSACTDKEMRDVFGFIFPIFDPTRKDKVHIYWFNQVYLALRAKVKVNWAQHMYPTVQKWGESLDKAGKPSYLSTILFYYYHFFGALTGPEEQRYTDALAEVRGQVEQIAPLRPHSLEVPPSRSTGTPSHPNLSSVWTNTPKQVRTRDAGDGSQKMGGFWHATPKPQTKLDSPDYSTDSADHGSDGEYIPVGGSSTCGWKRKTPSRSGSLEHSSKIPRLVQGMCELYAQREPVGLSQLGPPTVDFYARRSQGAEALVNQVPTTSEVPLTSMVPVAGTILTAGVPQQPCIVPTLGTADCPVELDHLDVAQDDINEGPAADQDQVPNPVHDAVPNAEVDFSHYDWLFTTAKGDRVPALAAGQSHYLDAMGKYTKAVEHYPGESTMRDI